jgi:hypothetical protein
LIAIRKPKFADYVVMILCRKLPKPDCRVKSLTISGLVLTDHYLDDLIGALPQSSRLTTVKFDIMTISEQNAILLFRTVSPFCLVRNIRWLAFDGLLRSPLLWFRHFESGQMF